MLHVVHLIESLHGGDNLRTSHLLVEGVNKAIGARSIIRGDGEGVKLWVDAVRLSAEGQASGQAEHVDSIFIEGASVRVLRVVHQDLRLEGPSNGALLKALTRSIVRL